MRISIRIQLAALVLVAALAGLAVISVATWITNYDFVYDMSSSNLALTASIKASQIASSLSLMQALVRNIATRTTIQVALRQYYLGNSTANDWVSAREDVTVTLGSDRGASFLVQAVVLGYNSSRRFIAQTAPSLLKKIELPYRYENGSSVFLGDQTETEPYIGYPRALYPNLTMSCEELGDGTTCQTHAELEGFAIRGRRSLVLGPYHINDTLSLISMTNVIVNTNNTDEVLGWMTVVLNAQLIVNSVDSREGLKQTGSTLVVGPTNITNRFPASIASEISKPRPDKSLLQDEQFHFLFSPNPGALREYDALPKGSGVPKCVSSGHCSPGNGAGSFNSSSVDGAADLEQALRPSDEERIRELERKSSGPSFTFNVSQFPAVLAAISTNQGKLNNAGSSIDTVNERGQAVAIGYAMPPTRMVDWVVLVEQDKDEVWSPIQRLRLLILICVFGTLLVMLLLSFPIAHYSTAPIRRLRDATRESVYGTDLEKGNESVKKNYFFFGSDPAKESKDDPTGPTSDKEAETDPGAATASPGQADGATMASTADGDAKRKAFRIPAKVKDRHHLVHDELTDLTRTFNAMADELLEQYSQLEDRVRQRTAELEASKKAAEKANEHKSVFIANVSHELKTPLNGIMGMCSVLMADPEMRADWRDNLGMVYYCGELLLKLVTDLLTFTKHQAGYTNLQQRLFRLDEVKEVIVLNLGSMASSKQIDLAVDFCPLESDFAEAVGADADCGERITGLSGLPVWADKDRLVQIVTNLVSNAVKFTPEGGRILVLFKAKEKTEDGMMLRLEVHDTGPGVPDDIREHIFEPFFQGELGLDRQYSGAGLGLSICAQLAELMGGTITVADSDGPGAVFALDLPMRLGVEGEDGRESSDGGGRKLRVDVGRVDETGAFSATSKTVSSRDSVETPTRSESTVSRSGPGSSGEELTCGSAGVVRSTPVSTAPSVMGPTGPTRTHGPTDSKVRVLVADDNSVNREVVRRMLVLCNISNVDVACDGQEAYEKVKKSMETDETGYGLVLMDVQMPVLTGPAATVKIRSELGFTGYVVGLSAYSEQQNVDECRQAGMDDFASKPLNRKRLERIVSRFVDRAE